MLFLVERIPLCYFWTSLISETKNKIIFPLHEVAAVEKTLVLGESLFPFEVFLSHSYLLYVEECISAQTFNINWTHLQFSSVAVDEFLSVILTEVLSRQAVCERQEAVLCVSLVL